MISGLYLLNIITIVPCFFEFFRKSVKILIYLEKIISEISESFDIILNYLYIFLALIVRLLPMINTSDLIAMNGAICCFFLVFFFSRF